jgi:hypothetical protein
VLHDSRKGCEAMVVSKRKSGSIGIGSLLPRGIKATMWTAWKDRQRGVRHSNIKDVSSKR